MVDENRPQDGFLGFLADIEADVRRMIVGVFRFIFGRLPTWLMEVTQRWVRRIRRLLDAVFVQFPRWLWRQLQAAYAWLEERLRYLIKASVRGVRVLGFLAIWITCVFWPLFFLAPRRPGSTFLVMMSFSWVVAALMGSIWGLRYLKSRRAEQQSADGVAVVSLSLRSRVGTWLVGVATVLVAVLGILAVLAQMDRNSEWESKVRVEAEAKTKSLDIDRRRHYPVVTSIVPGSIAESLPLRVDDIYVSYDGHDLRDADMSAVAAYREAAGVASKKTVEVVVIRDGQRLSFDVAGGVVIGVLLSPPGND